jgi:hypothetical protein
LLFDSALLKEVDEEVFEIYPLKLQIPAGQHICLYEEDQTLRDNLLYALTKNLTCLSDTTCRDRTLFLGGVPICDVSAQSSRLSMQPSEKQWESSSTRTSSSPAPSAKI